MRAKLGAAKDLAEFVAFLKSSDIKYSANEAVRGAEQLPLASLDRISQMKDGQSMFSVVPGGVSVLYLAGSRSQPVDEQRAVPAIEQFLLNSRKRKLVEDDLKALRGGSKIEYVGTYAADAAKAVIRGDVVDLDPRHVGQVGRTTTGGEDIERISTVGTAADDDCADPAAGCVSRTADRGRADSGEAGGDAERYDIGQRPQGHEIGRGAHRRAL